MGNVKTFNEYFELLNEAASTVVVKRKYGMYPEIRVGKYAPVRITVLSFILDKGGEISKEELQEFILLMNEDLGTKTDWNWVKKNSKFLKETKRGTVAITRYGKQYLEKIKLMEED